MSISFNEKEILCYRSDGTGRRLPWDRLGAVVVETGDQGPFDADVFWILIPNDGQPNLVYTGGTPGELELLEEMQNRLPGFDNEAVIAAAACLENNRFPVWKKEDPSEHKN